MKLYVTSSTMNYLIVLCVLAGISVSYAMHKRRDANIETPIESKRTKHQHVPLSGVKKGLLIYDEENKSFNIAVLFNANEEMDLKEQITFIERTADETQKQEDSNVKLNVDQMKTPLSTKSAFTIQLLNSVIKGYHAYKIQPPLMPFVLTVDRDRMNRFDVHACLVLLPNTATSDQLEVVTDSKRGLKLKDVLGRPCGHVPKGIAPAFRYVMDCGGSIEAQAIGEPLPSFPPWPPSCESGGGEVIPCNYIIHVSNRDTCMAVLKNCLSAMPERDAMTLI